MNHYYQLNADELKLLQKKNLEIAKYFINFCKEHNITCFLFAGSCLGAVRHQGFVPWDDDIDILMPAPDYDRLLGLWTKFGDKEKYSLCYTTKNYNDHRLSSSIKDNYTTFTTIDTVNLDVHQGLGLDIAPLHACPTSKIESVWQLLWASIASLFKAQRLPQRQSKTVLILSKVAFAIIRRDKTRFVVWSTAEKLASVYDKKFEKTIYVREFTMFPYIAWRYPKKWFDKAVWVTFEDAKMPIPVGARAYLKKRYGKYMELPPVKDRHPEHRLVFMDLNNSYKNYRGKYYCIERNN